MFTQTRGLKTLKSVSALVLAFSLSFSGLFASIDLVFADSVNPITVAASDITSTSATLNGTNGDTVADSGTEAFWYGPTHHVDPFVAGGMQADWTGGLYATSFNPAQGVPGDNFSYSLTGLTPSTTYYYVAWVSIGGTWYPGTEGSFVTSSVVPPPAPTTTTTQDATNITTNDATLNGTNGSSAADQESFWVSLNTFDVSTPNIPANVYSTPVLPGVAASGTFSDPLSIVSTQGIITGGFSGNLAITPNTTYYYVAWSHFNGDWHPGTIKSFTTNPIPDTTAPAVPTPISPADNTITTTAGQTLIDWSDVTDPSSPVTYVYQASNSSATNPSGAFTFPVYTSDPLTASEIPTPGTPEGVYYWHVKAIDAAGNYSAWSNSWKITVDNTSPTTDIVFPTPGPSATSLQVVFSEDVNQSEAENPANYFLTNWPGSGGNGDLIGDATVSYSSLTRTATVTFTNAGWYISPEQQWGVQNIHDLAGNLIAVNPYSEYSTSIIAPVTTDSGIDGNTHNSSVTVTLSCTDLDGSGCKNTYYTIDSTDPTISSSSGNSITLIAEGTYTIKYFSVDNAGNTEAIKTASNTVKIDKTAPTISGTPSNMTVEATSSHGAVVTWTPPTATDVFDGTDAVVCTPASGSTFAKGLTTVNCSSTDAAGNTSHSSFKVRVRDTTAPTINGTPSDMTVEATSSHGAVVTWAHPTATDAVDSTDPVICLPLSHTRFPIGTTTVHCASIDSSLNTSTTSFKVSVVDTTDPVINGTPSNKTVEATGPTGAVVTWTSPTATDVVSGTLPVTCSPISGSTFALGITTVNCGATDSAHNTGTSSFTITVKDTTAPTINGTPENMTLEAVSPSGTVATWESPTATDIVDGTDAVVCIPASGSTFVIGTTIVHCSSTDLAENPSSSSFTVTVHDTTLPVITLTGASIVNLTVGNTYTDAGATALDNINGDITESIVIVNSVNTAVAGTYTVTYNVHDSALNNAVEVTRTVIVANSTRTGGGGRIIPSFSNGGGKVLGAEKFIFTLNLKLGSKGDEVTELQKFLNAAGYICGPVNGKFGSKTKSCVIAFQKANPPLKVDGIVGPLTRAVLNK